MNKLRTRPKPTHTNRKSFAHSLGSCQVAQASSSSSRMLCQKISLSLAIFTCIAISVTDLVAVTKIRPLTKPEVIPKYKKDFDQLEGWLSNNTEPGYGFEKVLEFALDARNTDPEQFSPGALNALSALEKISKLDHCKDEYLELVKIVYVDSGLDMYQKKRYVDGLVDRLTRKVGGCLKYAQGKFTQILKTLNKNDLQTITKIDSHTFNLDWRQLNKVEVNTTPKQWAELIQDLAKQDERNVYVGEKTSLFCFISYCPMKANFNHVYEKYLLKPCQRYYEAMGTLMEPIYALSENTWIDRPDNFNQASPTAMSDEFSNGMARYFVCKDVVNNKLNRKELLNELYKRNKPSKE